MLGAAPREMPPPVADREIGPAEEVMPRDEAVMEVDAADVTVSVVALTIDTDDVPTPLTTSGLLLEDSDTAPPVGATGTLPVAPGIARPPVAPWTPLLLRVMPPVSTDTAQEWKLNPLMDPAALDTVSPTLLPPAKATFPDPAAPPGEMDTDP